MFANKIKLWTVISLNLYILIFQSLSSGAAFFTVLHPAIHH